MDLSLLWGHYTNIASSLTHPGPPLPRASTRSSSRAFLPNSNCHGEMKRREESERRGEGEVRYVRKARGRSRSPAVGHYCPTTN
jgi:hypothetical protein